MTFWHISALKISLFQTAPPASATAAFGGTGAGETLPLGTGSPLPFLSKVLEGFSCSQSNANTRWRLITETSGSTTKGPRGGGLSEDRQPWLCGENQWGREASHHLGPLTPGQPASQSLEAGPALDSGAGGAGTRRVSTGLAFRVPKGTGRGGLTQMPILIPRNDEYVTLYGIRSFAGVIKGLEKGALPWTIWVITSVLLRERERQESRA